MHGQNINLPVCVYVCVCGFVNTCESASVDFFEITHFLIGDSPQSGPVPVVEMPESDSGG